MDPTKEGLQKLNKIIEDESRGKKLGSKNITKEANTKGL